MDPSLIFAFTAGMVSTVNPCGFALLPVWFSRQMAGREGDSQRMRFLRAGLSAALASLGYVLMFALAAFILWTGAFWLGATLPYVGVSIGALLMLWGGLIVLNIRLPGLAAINKCRTIGARYGAFGFGLSYGFLSLSCSLPVFMAVAGISFLGGTPDIFNIIVFLGGAGAVLLIVSVLAAVMGTGLFNMVGQHQGIFKRFAGGLTALAGGYVFLYWGQTLFGDTLWIRAILDTGSYYAADLSALITANWQIISLIAFALVMLGWFASIFWPVQKGQAEKP